MIKLWMNTSHLFILVVRHWTVHHAFVCFHLSIKAKLSPSVQNPLMAYGAALRHMQTKHMWKAAGLRVAPPGAGATQITVLTVQRIVKKMIVLTAAKVKYSRFQNWC